MQIMDIKDIVRKDVPIYYRRIYTGVLVIELTNKQLDRNIEFLIENMPTGEKKIEVTLVDPIDYPLVPLKKELKKFIDQLDTSGKLPPL